MNIKKLCILSLISFIFLTGCTTNQQQNSENKQTEQKITELKKEKKSFEKEEDRNKKLDILKKTIQNQSKYKKETSTEKKVTSKYKKTIENMRDYFVSDYENRLKDNSIDDVSSIQDKAQLEDKKTQLNTLKEDLDKEFKYTLDSKDKYQEYLQKISDVVGRYDERISAIDEEQKQAEIAKEQEAQRTYSNEFFTITVPIEWGTDWSIEEDTDLTVVNEGFTYLRAFRCSHSTHANEPSGGGALIYVWRFDNDPLHRNGYYVDILPTETISQMHEIGKTSTGWFVEVENVAASFIDDGESGSTTSLATITLK